jgi:hypothetical protein
MHLFYRVCSFMGPTGNNPFKIQAEVSCRWKFVHVQVVRRLKPPSQTASLTGESVYIPRPCDEFKNA